MKRIRWDIVITVVVAFLLAWWLVTMSWEIVVAIEERPVLQQRVERLERERDSLMDELFVRDVELSRMTLSIEETMTPKEQEKFWEWMDHNTE